MNTQDYSVLNRVKKLKLAKNRKPSDLFRLFKSEEKTEIKAAKQKELLPHVFPKASKDKRAEVLEQIKVQFPSEQVKNFKKKDKRARKHLFPSELEWNVFCSWVNICRRSAKKNRRKGKPKKKRRSSYQVFIASDSWADRKNAYYKNHKRQCAACGSFKHIHLHHMVYGEFGKEPDEHLIPLCETHHNEYHGKNGTKRHMIRSTMDFIEKVKTRLTHESLFKESPNKYLQSESMENNICRPEVL